MIWQLPFLGFLGCCGVILLTWGADGLLRAYRALWGRNKDGLNHELEDLQRWGRSR